MLLIIGRVLVFAGLAIAAFMGGALTFYATYYDFAPAPIIPSPDEVRAIFRRSAMIAGALLAITLCVEQLRKP